MCISYSKYKTGHISHALHDQREQLVDIPKPSSSPVQRTSALHASITTSNTRFMLLVTVKEISRSFSLETPCT